MKIPSFLRDSLRHLVGSAWRISRSRFTIRRNGYASSRRPWFETLEERWTPAIDLLAPIDLTWNEAPAVDLAIVPSESEIAPAPVAQQPPLPSAVIFVDPSVRLDGALDAAPDVKVVTLEADSDPLEQIANALQGMHDLSAIHILSHGREGSLLFAGGVVDQTQLAEHSSQLAAIGAALAPDGDIELWGCDVAAGADGEAFIEELARLTNADVAASTDATGAADLGGNWILEASVGTIDAGLSFDSVDVRGLLAPPLVITGTAGNDVISVTFDKASVQVLVNGVITVKQSVRPDEIDINALAGNDVIQILDRATGIAGVRTIVDGGAGNDTIQSSAGDDILFGGEGLDSIVAGAGNDIIVGGGDGDKIDVGTGKPTAAAAYSDVDAVSAGRVIAAGASLFDAANASLLSQLRLATAELAQASNVVKSLVATNQSLDMNAAIATAAAAMGSNPLVASLSAAADDAAADSTIATSTTVFFPRAASDSVSTTTVTGLPSTYSRALPTPTELNLPPVIASNGGGATASISINENTRAVSAVIATDPNLNSAFTYSLAGGADQSRFQIDYITGALSFVAAPDFEAPNDSGTDNVYNVVVRVTDGGGLYDDQAIAVTVVNVAEGPTITSNGSGATASISSNENTTAVAMVAATSPLPNTTLFYSIIGGADQSRFEINSTTGALSFVSAPDFETPTDSGQNNVYDVVVQVANASDGSLTDTQAIAVAVMNVNEAPPVIASNGGGATASIPINENGTAVATVAAVDPDANSTLTYSIIGGADQSKFQINATTGALSFVSAPDFETPTDSGANNIYDVIVQASDGSYTDSQTLAVAVLNLNEAPPVIASNGGGATASVSINENAIAVATVTATDSDANTTFAYSIIGGADQNKFAINATTGALTFISAPDSETPTDNGLDNVYDVIVQVSDGNFTDSQAIAVTVGNVNDAPVIASNGGEATVSISISENVTAVAVVAATDQDASTTLIYSIIGGADQSKFQIDQTTGALTFLSAPDFETPTDSGGDNVYDVVVQVSDGGLTDDQAIAIAVGNVNDASPVIGSSGGGATASISINENSIAVATVAATDPDNNTTLAYSIVGGADAASFQIDSTTGVLTFIAAPDFETPADVGADNVFDVVVRVTDSVNTDTQAIAVAVLNLNESAPVITSNGGGATANISINENSTAVATVTAADPDLNATLVFAIVGGADQSKFQINSATGALSFLSAPDFETPTDSGANNVYDVVVQASDGSFTDTQAIAVAVGNVNEAPPVITSNGGGATASIAINENATAVATVTAFDPDANTTLTYSIVGGADQARFQINPTTGALTFNPAPNFEIPTDNGPNNVYDVIVQVSDGVNTDAQTIAVTVGNVNESAPVISSNSGGATASISINENTTAVTTVTATDADANPTLIYSLAGGADQSKFQINASTGVLTFIAAPDFEIPTDNGANNIYDVVVQVTDGSRTDTQAIAITVNNIAEAPATLQAVNDSATTTVGTPVTINVLANDTSPRGTPSVSGVGFLVDDHAASPFENIVGRAGSVAILSNVDDSGQTVNIGFAFNFYGTNYTQFYVTSNGTITLGGSNTRFTPIDLTPTAAFPAVLAVDWRDWDTRDTLGPNTQVTYLLTGTPGVDQRLIVQWNVQPYASSANYSVFEAAIYQSGVIEYRYQTVPLRGASDTIGYRNAQPDAVALGQVNQYSYRQASISDGQTIRFTPTGATGLFSEHGGPFVINADKTITYTPPTGFSGTDTLRYQIVDSTGAVSIATVTINVAPPASPPTITSNGGGATASLSSSENATAVTTVTATDPDANTTLTYSIVGGADQSKFQINPTTGALTFQSAPNYEAPTDNGQNNIYDVIVQASDGNLTDTQAIAVTVTNVNEAPAITSNGGGTTASVSVNENTTAVTTATAADPDTSATLTYSIVGGVDQNKFQINSTTGALSFQSAPDFETPTDSGSNNVYDVVVQVSDGSITDTQAIAVTVVDIDETFVFTNGDFESGLAGWTVTDSGNGTWRTNDGTLDPIGPEGARNPISGQFDAVVDVTGPGTHELWQLVSLPTNVASATIGWMDRIDNHYTEFSDPNQEFRVVLKTSDGTPLLTVYSTNPGDPLIQGGPNNRSFDVTAFVAAHGGETIRISFEADIQLNFMNIYVDNVSFVTQQPQLP